MATSKGVASDETAFEEDGSGQADEGDVAADMMAAVYRNRDRFAETGPRLPTPNQVLSAQTARCAGFKPCASRRRSALPTKP